MNSPFFRVIAIVSALASSSSWAAETTCPSHFFGGEAPNTAILDVRELCFSEFAVLHSDERRTPLWSAEHLTRDRIEAARSQRRRNAFHAEPRLQPENRAELSDYAQSGYDRGHMAPSGDMPDPESQRESFSLANMIPQDPSNNRGVWARLEAAVRKLAEERGEVFVVTGPVFGEGAEPKRLNDRVSIPSRIFKAIYAPGQGAGVYLTPNGPGNAWQVVSLAELKNLAGIDVFPGLDAEEKEHAVALPGPGVPRSHKKSDNDDVEQDE